MVGSHATTRSHRSQLEIPKLKPRKNLLPQESPLVSKVGLGSIYLFLITSTLVILFVEPFSSRDWCSSFVDFDSFEKIDYDNPDFDQNPCRVYRNWGLLFLTQKECDYARRALISVLLGGIIGYERKSANRPAGIRTMSLVSLGSCFFSISSMRAFRSSTMDFDAARVAAAIPSGVGFLGAGLIWKGTQNEGEKEVPSVHGLTTAASLWLSAAIGVACGGRLYVVAVYTVALVIVVLRLGPRLYLQEDDVSYLSDDKSENWDTDVDENEETDGNESDYDMTKKATTLTLEEATLLTAHTAYTSQYGSLSGASHGKIEKGEIQVDEGEMAPSHELEFLLPVKDHSIKKERSSSGFFKNKKYHH